ncbi:MAG: hypothetical protein HY062_17730 [Bacteroidetes bacterium]|nr:hypothetical protein [Bacteroidota bacterium]
MHKYLLYFFLFFSLLFSVSCNKEKLKSPQAAFLVADPVLLKTTPSQGSNSHKITDIWYYVNGQFKGVFPVGSVMPIVANGNTDIMFMAGIKNNGISATRIPYPCYNSIAFSQNFEPGKTYTVSPQFEYTSTTHILYSDNFDSTGSYFYPAGDSSYTFTQDPSKAFGGVGRSVFMSMSNAKPSSEMLQSSTIFLPGGGTTIYLELNYRCNQEFVVGVIGDGTDMQPAVTVNRSDEWNKIYIQLTSVVSSHSHFGYQVFIRAQKQVDTPEIYIDNVKLLYQ